MEDKIRRIRISYLVTVVLGIIFEAKIVAYQLTSFWLGNYQISVNDYAKEYFWNAEKPYDIVRYCITTLFICIFCTILAYFNYSQKHKNKIDKIFQTVIPDIAVKWITLISVIDALLYASSFLKNGKILIISTVALSLLFISIVIWPFIDQYIHQDTDNKIIRPAPMWRILLIITILTFSAMLFPFLFEKVPLLNEYWDMPSFTNISKKYQPPIYVSNINYIAEHGLTGFPRSTGKNYFAIIPLKQPEIIQCFLHNSKSMFIDLTKSSLIIIQTPPEDEFYRILSVIDEPIEKHEFIEGVSKARSNELENYNRQLTEKEKIFLNNNIESIHQQILNRWVIHHHNYMVAPINELILGRNRDETYFQYGYWTTNIVKSVTKFLFDDITYQGYFPVLYSFYIIYFIIFLLCSWLIFRDIKEITILSIIIVTGISFCGYKLLLLGPGNNPIRHLLDLPTAILLWYGLSSGGSRRVLWITLACATSLLGIGLCKEFGILCSIAMTTIIAISIYETPGKIIKCILFALFIMNIGLALFIYKHVGIGIAGESIYYLKGLLGFKTSEVLQVLISIVMSLIIGTLLFSVFRERSPIKLLTIFFGIYSSELGTYWIWNNSIDHLLSHIWIYAIFSLLYYKCFSKSLNPHIIQRLKFIIISVLISLEAVGAIYFFYQEKMFFIEFRNHKVYEWNFDRAKVISTIDPKPIENSIQLINKYSGGSKSISMISKYDNILPFLAHKYSDMKYFELGNFLITSTEYDEVINSLKNNPPKSIFIDRDIMNDCRYDTIPVSTPLIGSLSNESFWRAERINLLRGIYLEIKENYKLVEENGLLSFYIPKNCLVDPLNNSKP